MRHDTKAQRFSLLAREIREILARGAEILEARRNPEVGKRKWADFGEVYDTWNRKAEDLLRTVCGAAVAAKWNFFDCHALYGLELNLDLCLKEQQRKQAMLTEHVARKPQPAFGSEAHARGGSALAGQPATARTVAVPGACRGLTAVPRDSRVTTPAYRAGRPNMPDRVFRVLRDFQFARSKSGKRAPTDRDLYEWLKVNGRESCSARRHDFGTWTRYLREARKLLGRQKPAS